MDRSKGNWICTGCGSPFTRASSCRRHIGSKHLGMGSPVREADYLIGRQSGIFAPSPYNSGTGNKPTFKHKVDERSIFEIAQDEWFLEYWREAGRIAARNNFQPSYRFAATSSNYQQPVSAFDSNKQLFGMTAYVCRNCFAIKPKMIYFSGGEKGGWDEEMLYCTFRIPDHVLMMKEKIDDYVIRLSKGFPQYLERCVNAWTNGKNSIAAVEISDPARTSNIITIVLTGRVGRKFSITLQYSEENCTKLDPSNTGGWALRAIEDKHTIVNDQELLEFLGMTNESTFGFFKKEDKNGVNIYLMSVAKRDEGSKIDLSVDKDIEPIRIPDSAAKEEPDFTQPDQGDSAQASGNGASYAPTNA